MPRYKTHLIIGAITYCITLAILLQKNISPQHALIGISLCLIGSIFPDIDIHSKMQKLFFRSVVIIIPLLILMQKKHLFFSLGLIIALIPLLRHRTLTHDIRFLILMPGTCVLYATYNHEAYFYSTLTLAIFFINGAISHVLADRFIAKIRPRKRS